MKLMIRVFSILCIANMLFSSQKTSRRIKDADAAKSYDTSCCCGPRLYEIKALLPFFASEPLPSYIEARWVEGEKIMDGHYAARLSYYDTRTNQELGEIETFCCSYCINPKLPKNLTGEEKMNINSSNQCCCIDCCCCCVSK